MSAVGPTLLNLVIAIALVVYMVRRRTAYSVAMSILIYTNLHHAYLVLFIPLGQKFIDLHKSPPWGPTVVGTALLLFALIWILWLYRFEFPTVLQSRLVRWYAVLTAGLCALVLSDWVWNCVATGTIPEKLVVKESLASLYLLIMALPLGISLARDSNSGRKGWKTPIYAILLMQAASVTVGLYEVFGHTWAAYMRGDGVIVFRASGLFFNPNVLGFWSVFVILAGCYLYQRRVLAPVYTFSFLIFGAAGLFLSGSRSALLLTMIILSVILLLAVFKKAASRVGVPVLVMITAFTSILVVSKQVQVVVGDSGIALAALADRFLDMPIAIIAYVASRLELQSWLPIMFADSGVEARNVTISVEGRFGGREIVDNGYIAMRKNTGTSSVVIWMLTWIVILWFGSVAIAKKGTAETIYAMALVVSGLLTGVFMRAYQVVPVSLVISVSLAYALSVALRSDLDARSPT